MTAPQGHSRVKLTLEVVRDRAATAVPGYTLLSTSYVNAATRLQWQCPTGHIFEMAWSQINAGSRCPRCSPNARKPQDAVAREFSTEGYSLESTYLGRDTPVMTRCPQGHEFHVSRGNFVRGHRCPECGGVPRKTWESVAGYIASQGYHLLSPTYRCSSGKLKLECPEGHHFITT